MSAKRHRHVFSALYYRFGPYGDQHVHIHPCWDPECDRVLIGEGRECAGESAEHRRDTLTERPRTYDWAR